MVADSPEESPAKAKALLRGVACVTLERRQAGKLKSALRGLKGAELYSGPFPPASAACIAVEKLERGLLAE